MKFPWNRKPSMYDLMRELNQIELAIEWRTDQVRLLYQTIDFLRDHKQRIANKRAQYEKYNAQH
jgi:hypothetical protein